jgi:hypothetical protein
MDKFFLVDGMQSGMIRDIRMAYKNGDKVIGDGLV